MLLLVALFATLAFAAPAQATTLVNDPAHPFGPRQLAAMRYALNASAVPTPAVVSVHRGECPNAVACANVNRGPAGWLVQPGSLWIDGWDAQHDRFAFMHEVGHIMDVETYTPAKRARLKRLLRMVGQWMPDARFDPGTTPPYERAADAYAMCSIHPRWPGTWWSFVIHRRGGTLVAGGNPTPYDFRAYRARYYRICEAIRTP